MLLPISKSIMLQFFETNGFWQLHLHFPFLKQTIYCNHPITNREIKLKQYWYDQILRFITFIRNLCHDNFKGEILVPVRKKLRTNRFIKRKRWETHSSVAACWIHFYIPVTVSGTRTASNLLPFTPRHLSHSISISNSGSLHEKRTSKKPQAKFPN